MEMDMISQLPDDILISIITRIPTKEAVRTSILSKKWRNLYKFVSTINISCHCFSPKHAWTNSCAFKVINDGLYQFSKLHSGFIRCLEYRCLSHESYENRFEECIYLLGKCIEKLVLQFDCSLFRQGDLSFSCGLLSHMPSLTYFKLKYCTLKPTLNCLCNSLKFLKLSRVTVLPGSLECILSNCLNLSSLLIQNCDLPSKVCFRSPSLQLKCIMVHDYTYSHVEEIEIHAGNLITFEFIGEQLANIILDYVPQLQNIYLCSCSNTMSYCWKLAKELPHLKSLLLDIQHDVYDFRRIVLDRIFPVRFNMFSQLKRLELCIYYAIGYNLFSCSPLLRHCPLLQELHLVTNTVLEPMPAVTSHVAEIENQVIEHSHLKKVDMGGFNGTQDQLDFILYLFKSAVRLDEMCLSWESNMYVGFGKWEVPLYFHELRQNSHEEHRLRSFEYVQQLRQHAVSNTLQVIYQKHARVKSKRFNENWILVD